MSRKQVWIVLLAVVFLIITLLLLPITINISTGYLSVLPPWVEDWVKKHIFVFFGAAVVFGLFAVLLGGISAYLQLSSVNSSLPFNDELDLTTDKVNIAADTASKDPMLMGYSNRLLLLRNWKQLAETLSKAYGDYATDYKTHGNKESKHAATQTADLLGKLVKHTRRSFVYLNRKSDFATIARSAYDSAFAQERWKYAADLAYEVGRVYNDLGKHNTGGIRDWIEPLRTCLEKANFDGYWIQVYNEMRRDKPGMLDEPRDRKAQIVFHEALAYAAKLYDLEGLSKQDDEEALASFEKALTRASRLSDTVLYSWIKIHMAKLALRLHIQPMTYYAETLASLDASDLLALNPPQRSDIVNLKLTCYYHLGNLALLDRRKDWYQKQLELAKEYGALDFQVLAHMELSQIALRQGSDQSESFQTAYEHIKQAWVTNENLGNEADKVVEPNELAQLMIAIVDELIKRSIMNSPVQPH